MLIPASAPTSSVQTSNYTSCCLQIKMLMTMMMLMLDVHVDDQDDGVCLLCTWRSGWPGCSLQMRLQSLRADPSILRRALTWLDGAFNYLQGQAWSKAPSWDGYNWSDVQHPCVKKVDQRKKNCICKISNNSLPGARTLGIPRWQEVHSPRWQEETFTPSSFPPVIRSRPPPAPYPWENFPSQCAANVSPSTLQFADVSGQYVHREDWGVVHMPTGKPCPNGLLFSIMLWSGIYCSGKPCANGDRADACPPT